MVDGRENRAGQCDAGRLSIGRLARVKDINGRFRAGLLASALVLVVACSGPGGATNGGSSDGGLGATGESKSVPTTACTKTPLRSTEVGVTASTITVTVVADTKNAIRPGVFQGSWDGMKAWEKYVNANGGLACRRVKVKTANSALSPTEAANAVDAACGDSIALVGTTAVFLNNVSTLNGCRDPTGKCGRHP